MISLRLNSEINKMRIDKRTEELADLVLDYSVDIQEKDRLLIQFDPKYKLYADILGKKAMERGAEVCYDSISFDPKILRKFIQEYNLEEWEKELKRRKEIAIWCNTRILVDCISDYDYARGIENSEVKVAEFDKKVIGPYKKVLYRTGPNNENEVKWNIVGFPCEENAKCANMSFTEYEDFVYSATLIPDWEKMSNEMEIIKDKFNNAKEVQILLPGLTDLHFSLDGRGGKICKGKRNMPDGEVYYGPVENSAEGYIYFQCPTKRDGFGMLEGIKLEFERGFVKDYSAKQNQKGLEETLKIDLGARRIGEFGIGCNYGIKHVTFETLFDEKIGGTIHLALGKSISERTSEGGGWNKSNIHWDIICDLRRNEKNLREYPGGKIFVDGTLVQENGIWKI